MRVGFVQIRDRDAFLTLGFLAILDRQQLLDECNRSFSLGFHTLAVSNITLTVRFEHLIHSSHGEQRHNAQCNGAAFDHHLAAAFRLFAGLFGRLLLQFEFPFAGFDLVLLGLQFVVETFVLVDARIEQAHAEVEVALVLRTPRIPVTCFLQTAFGIAVATPHGDRLFESEPGAREQVVVLSRLRFSKVFERGKCQRHTL